MNPAVLESLGLLVARFHAVTRALVAKGVLSQEEIDAHYPRTEEQRKQIYKAYFEPFLGSPEENGEK